MTCSGAGPLPCIAMTELNIDPKRLRMWRFEIPEIVVGALDERGRHLAVDITCLDRESLLRWLRRRGGNNLRAENTVLLLLGHQVEGIDE
jgi:hypothetical protein